MQKAILQPSPARAQALKCHRARQSSRSARLRCYANAGPDWSGRQFTLLSMNEDATTRLAGMLAADLRAGDAYCLKGDEGAGKTFFSRAFIRAAAHDPSLDVPPPPKGLQPNEFWGRNVYVERSTDGQEEEVEVTFPLLHMDVGGLQRPSDAECERLAALFPDAVALIEWAQTLRDWGCAPEQRLAIYFRRLPNSEPDSPARVVTVVPHTGQWEYRARLLHAHLSATGTSAGLVVLSDEMASSLTAGLPESLMLGVGV